MVNSYSQPLQNLSILKRVADIAGEEQRREWAQYFIIDGFNGNYLELDKGSSVDSCAFLHFSFMSADQV